MPSIKYKKKTYAGSSVPVLEMTKAQYDALPVAKQNDGTIYLITDDDGGWEAERSTYDNTDSGLTATNVQDALDEIAGDVSGLSLKVPRQIEFGTINADYSIKVTANTFYETSIYFQNPITGVVPTIYLTPQLWSTPSDIQVIAKTLGSSTGVPIRVLSKIETTDWAVHWLAIWP